MERSEQSTGRPVFIVDGARTPFIKAQNKPGPFTPVDLAVEAGRPLLERQPFDRRHFDEVILGCVNVHPDEVNPGRVAGLRLGLGIEVPGWTVQRNCASGLQSIDSGFRAIAQGLADLVLTGGTEALSHAPLLFSSDAAGWFGSMASARTTMQRLQRLTAFRPAHLKPSIGLVRGLTDPVVKLNMGQTAEVLAHRFDISREEMDAYALESHRRLAKAQADGHIEELVPMIDRKGVLFDRDDGVRPEGSMADHRRRELGDSRLRAGSRAVQAGADGPHRRLQLGRPRSERDGARAGAVDGADDPPQRAQPQRHRRFRTQRGVRRPGARLPARAR